MEFLSRQYWEQRYQQQQTGWDIGAPSPPLAKYINNISNKDAAVLIPGCGIYTKRNTWLNRVLQILP
jgi:methyl halide transferase